MSLKEYHCRWLSIVSVWSVCAWVQGRGRGRGRPRAVADPGREPSLMMRVSRLRAGDAERQRRARRQGQAAGARQARLAAPPAHQRIPTLQTG